MKKLFLTTLMLCFSILLIAQAKYKPKVIAIFLSPENETFDPSRFPDIDFYYIKKVKYKNPEGMLNYKAGQALAFDKNGTLITYTNAIGWDMRYWPDRGNFCTQKRGKYTNLNDLSKEYIKKGKTMKEGSKFKSKDPSKLSSKYLSFKVPDFPVYSVDGEETSFAALTKDNPLTLAVFTFLDPDFDGNKAHESGKGKTGKQFWKEVKGTVEFEHQLADVQAIEEVIFGRDVRR